MFGLFGARPTGNQPQQQPQQTPQQPPAQQTPAQPQQQQPAQQQAPVQQPQTPAQPQTVSMADLLSKGAGEDPVAFAEQLIDALSAASSAVDPTQGQQIQINPTALSEALAGIDMTNGADLQKLFESQNDPTAFSTELKGIMQQVSQNTIATMVPLMNQLVAQAVAATQQQTLQMSQQAVTVDNLINTFRNTHEYASNPLVSRMVSGMAEAMVKHSPPGTSIQTLVDALHATMSGISMTTGTNPRGNNPPGRAAQTDFSGLFK